MNEKERDIMYNQIDSLSKYLNLNQYQLSKLKTDYDKYNISKLEKRGGVLYAPYVVTGFWKKLLSVLFGRQADLIGENKILLRAQRNIKFCENGYHRVRIGRYTYYADATGNVVSRDEFLDKTKH